LKQTWMLGGDDCGRSVEWMSGEGNGSTRRKPAPVPLCPLQIPYDLTRGWIRAAADGSRRIITWAMALLNTQFPTNAVRSSNKLNRFIIISVFPSANIIIKAS
jgi:hypothetical protein